MVSRPTTCAIPTGPNLHYVRLVKGDSTSRTIRPREWVDEDRFTAFCELRNAERDFRVSRINKCVPLE